MSESLQVTPSANTGAAQLKFSSLESGNDPASSDNSADFTAIFASFVESEPSVIEFSATDQGNITDLLNELLPQDILEDGNSLPEDEKSAMWQVLMLLQPAENIITNSTSKQMQSISLLDNQHKPVLNSSWLNQDYFRSQGRQNKEAGTPISSGLAANNISTQPAAAHFTPDTKESLFLNINEQLMPVQGTSSSLSQGMVAIGFGTATQAATAQTQMVPLNLRQNTWETNLGSRLQMLVGQNVQTAEIRLDPPELGALDIKIKITNDIATVNITSPHTQVREALETAVPRLKEMFEENGLSLGDVNVRQESFSRQQNSAEEEVDVLTHVTESEFADEPMTVSRKIVSDSLLDIYA